MYLQLDEYPPYSDKKSYIFETHINRNLRCNIGYTNYIAHNDLNTCFFWEMLLSEFSREEIIIPCPRKIICNNCEQMNVLGDIFNDDGNVKN